MHYNKSKFFSGRNLESLVTKTYWIIIIAWDICNSILHIKKYQD
jgi:hypothetical protein